MDRLRHMVEQGLMDLDDPALEERLETAKLARLTAINRVRMLDRPGKAGANVITLDKVERLAGALRETPQTGDTVSAGPMRLFVVTVVVGRFVSTARPQPWLRQARPGTSRIPRVWYPVICRIGVPYEILTEHGTGWYALKPIDINTIEGLFGDPSDRQSRLRVLLSGAAEGGHFDLTTLPPESRT